MGRCRLTGEEVTTNDGCDRWEAVEAYYVPFQKGLDNALMFPFGVFYRGNKREFTRADGEAMVRNFQQNVLGRTDGRLPVNREHQRAQGRIGWITGLWMADDGVRTSIVPVPGHEEEIKGFDYLSPEVVWEWTHPYTNQTHRSVLFGAALTNYPYLLGKTAAHHVWTEKGWDMRQQAEATQAAFVHEVPLGMADAAQQIVYGVVFQPDEPDGEGHVMATEDIEAACHRFMEFIQFAAHADSESPKASLDAHHARPVHAEEARIVECWIQREPVVWQFGERETEVLPGSWCLGVKILSDELWAEVESGEITGFSPKGWGTH